MQRNMAFTYYFAVLQCKANVAKMGWLLFPVHILHTMNELIKQTFEGQNITFKTENNVIYVNATEMAKPFGKFVANWMDKDSTKEYLEELNLIIGNPIIKLVNKQAGRYGGTWMHEDVAMEFARWLSPKFAIWCNKQIKTLFTTGHIELAPKTDAQKVLEAISILQRQVEEQQAQLIEQTKKIEEQGQEIEKQSEAIEERDTLITEQKPKVDYYDKAMSTDGLYTATQIAKEFNKNVKEFNILLHKLGIQYNVNGQWVLYGKYLNQGYTSSKTYFYSDTFGNQHKKLTTLWTEKGRKFIYDLLSNMAI